MISDDELMRGAPGTYAFDLWLCTGCGQESPFRSGARDRHMLSGVEGGMECGRYVQWTAFRADSEIAQRAHEEYRARLNGHHLMKRNIPGCPCGDCE